MVKVILTPEAIEDVHEIYDYILERDGQERSETILNHLEKQAYSLNKLAQCGKLPDELVPFCYRKIREVQETPWRIFYRIEKNEVVVLAVLDGQAEQEQPVCREARRASDSLPLYRKNTMVGHRWCYYEYIPANRNIPPDRRLRLDLSLPDSIPPGDAEVVVVLSPSRTVKSKKSLLRFAGCLADSKTFAGDPLAVQKALRDEW
ncbi:type II toxin-antitoxin system RelE/ParE family toxin [Desulfovibrio sp. OttesenSCG-928-A18]|nr:type II toxin-antitoxin system RelE/ParE family toxin [Desulfovibrio sp. OttesenSCG-928-A18]